ncbi:hypothetical protein SZN_34227 [Streptomyces zinciresistens K42]|uniref:Peptidase M15C domain-containing protein n=1 Tax=Streptomyces zinciresistens K42 TaxID=700597 RepID=G2GMU0_9ACTN|nr:M15 family metallopeptidase [Streptomyces zinciresistens]EGX55178.1 hypothetical protein SZN_34227 [Streptomyces zinciresistens K42]
MIRVTTRVWAPLVTAALLLTTACTGAGSGTGGAAPSATRSAPSSAPSSTGPASAPRADAVVRPVSAAQWQRIRAAGMVREGCPVTSPDQLRRVELNHYGFDGKVRRGVLVVNADTAESVARVFTRLFEAKFPIRGMKPLEEYGGDNTTSLADDNTASFNCRRPNQINAPEKESPHGNGRAIDINPVENPWQDLRCKCWKPSAANNARTEGQGKILEGGTVWRAFRAEGWIWQDISVPDYMHFDTGYPSVPFTGPQRATGSPAAG